MKMKLIGRYSTIVLCLMLFSFIIPVHRPCSSNEKTSSNFPEAKASNEGTNNNKPEELKSHQLIVFYFHGNDRCYTCKRIEKLTQEAVQEAFSDETKAGVIEMKVVNVDQPENKHFVYDYQLFTKSVIVSDIVEGKENRWKNLQKVWQYVRDDRAFKEYIKMEVKEYLS